MTFLPFLGSMVGSIKFTAPSSVGTMINLPMYDGAAAMDDPRAIGSLSLGLPAKSKQKTLPSVVTDATPSAETAGDETRVSPTFFCQRLRPVTALSADK